MGVAVMDVANIGSTSGVAGVGGVCMDELVLLEGSLCSAIESGGEDTNGLLAAVAV